MVVAAKVAVVAVLAQVVAQVVVVSVKHKNAEIILSHTDILQLYNSQL